MPVIGSNSEILKEYLGSVPTGQVYLGGTQVQFGEVPVVETPYYWFNPDIVGPTPSYLTGSNQIAWSSSNALNTNTSSYLEVESAACGYFQGKPKHWYPKTDYIRMESDKNSTGLPNMEIDRAVAGNFSSGSFNFWMNVTGSDYVNPQNGSVIMAYSYLNNYNWSLAFGDGGGSGSAAYGVYLQHAGAAISFGDIPDIPYGGSGSWVNFALTWEGYGIPTAGNYPQLEIKGYVNGELVATNLEANNWGLGFGTTNYARVGYAGVSDNKMRSKLGDFMFYRKTLTAGEVKQNYQALKSKYG